MRCHSLSARRIHTVTAPDDRPKGRIARFTRGERMGERDKLVSANSHPGQRGGEAHDQLGSARRCRVNLVAVTYP